MNVIYFVGPRFFYIFTTIIHKRFILKMQKVLFTVLILTGLFLISSCDSGTDQTTETEGIEDQRAPQQQAPQMTPPQGVAELTDDDLRAFAEIDAELRDIQMQAREDMIGIIEDQGMTLEQYQQIAQMQQQGMGEGMSDEDAQTISQINDEMGEIQMEMQNIMETRIAEMGMSMDRYQEIAMTIQQNPEYQQRIQAMQEGDL
ncbi:MAG: DUF4168 domain-containing protein [Saprospirales bacterium]|nr:MAG: DUF4168 domain-containing protein [Saprospirales bacterium]